MNVKLGFGQSYQELHIPDENVEAILHANNIPETKEEQELITAALQNPIGTKKLCELVKPGMKIAIITSDITRPMPTYKVIGQILDEMYAAGVKKENIVLVFALGSHRNHTSEEIKKIAGERAVQEILCVDANSKDVVHMGTTTSGTPVDITRCVAEADFRIALGNIEYHYFAGYSGGAKAIMPGVATREAIQANHRFMVKKEACAGNIDDNPVRKDIEEAVREFCKVDFILNVVLDEHKKIVCAVAGDVVKAHRKGCMFLDKIYRKEIKHKADIVVVSQGGAPKDLNLYQLQKSLDNAKHAVKKDGIIILVGSAKEGYGEKIFSEWIDAADSPQALINRIEREFTLGGHKAAAIAMVEEIAEVILVSEMPDKDVINCFMKPMKNLQQAFDYAMQKKGDQAKVIIMPFGGSTLPILVK